MREQNLRQVCESLGVKPGRVSSSWMNIVCPLAPWTHTNGPNSDSAQGKVQRGGLSVSNYGKSKFMCRVCQHTPLDMWELHQRLEHFMHTNPYPRNINLNMLRAMVVQEQTQVFDELEVAAHELQGRVAEGQDWVFQEETRTRPWPEEFLLNFTPILENDEAHHYCTARGITDVVMDHLGMLWDPKQRRVCFPIRTEDWELVGLHGRTIDDYRPVHPEWVDHPWIDELVQAWPELVFKPEKEPLRYYAYACNEVRNSHIWCNQHLVDMNQPVILTEGNFDYAAIMSAGYFNVLGSRSVGIHHLMMKYLEKAHMIITYYDRGQGGDTARERISKYFEGTGRVVRHIVPLELNDDAGNTPACVIQDNISRFIL